MCSEELHSHFETLSCCQHLGTIAVVWVVAECYRSPEKWMISREWLHLESSRVKYGR